ncbi:MAG: ribonuclease P protein component [Candidatus Levyibacteriota bacterium]|nr:MAG: ribonuclease P protein component [Candidatus Levybacteria bacterium]
MLKRKYRLSARSRLQNPSVVHTPFFTMRYIKNNLLYSRFGFIVSKKVDKRAVVRNTVKRKVRLFVENMREKIVSGYDLLFSLKKSAINEDFTSLSNYMENIFRKEKLLT